ncbi:hypothetical protein QWJ34_04695 [Saccharibacillus sp. CPCC 101409]|uniref:hypothetical protein n=1 Tax=Saccharibacillus sp. CPCC 101409 TaxID=3058041 RepID=UPI002672CD1A|nr:hypothetical protein [Saccharibacillus sp. CPCC 101409]MDO3409052.1 hypothetical protein [Saccharibacillus sp. CPCC 101409]
MKIKKFIPFTVLLILILAGTACSKPAPQEGTLEYAESEVGKTFSGLKLPELDGAEISMVVLQHWQHPDEEADPKDPNNTDTVIIGYVEQRGEKAAQIDDEDLHEEARLLYGVYKGDTVAALAIGKLPVETGGAEESEEEVDGVAMQVYEAGEGLIAVARPKDLTYTLQGVPSESRSREQLLKLLAEAVNEQ